MSFGSVPVLEIFSVLSFGENKLCQVKRKKNEKGGEFSRHGGLWHARNWRKQNLRARVLFLCGGGGGVSPFALSFRLNYSFFFWWVIYSLFSHPTKMLFFNFVPNWYKYPKEVEKSVIYLWQISSLSRCRQISLFHCNFLFFFIDYPSSQFSGFSTDVL